MSSAVPLSRPPAHRATRIPSAPRRRRRAVGRATAAWQTIQTASGARAATASHPCLSRSAGTAAA
ncbi:hypothetical protein ACFQX6_26775 [Streptosporangium lutulentum]